MNGNEPAFPAHGWSSNPEVLERMKTQGGMTKREYFAGCVIGPLIASNGFEKQLLDEHIKIEDLPKFAAEVAVECADALIAELNKAEEPKQ
jgi:hypothetical protein